MSALLWALPGLPLTVGLLLLGGGRRGDGSAAAVALLTLLAALGIAAWAALARPAVAAPWLPALPMTLGVDGLSAVMVVTVAAVALPLFGYAARELSPTDARARCFGFLLVFVAAMLITVTATSLGVLLLGWELMALASYGLIGFWWQDDSRPRAASRAYLFTRLGDLGLYAAAGAALAGAGTLALAELPGAVTGPWLHVVAGGLIIAAATKSAQAPFSAWLPAAMRGPTHLSALLYFAILIAVGGYLLLRTLPILVDTRWALPLIAWLGVLTTLSMGLVALAQRDLKQMLAASSAAQKGLIFLAAGAGSVAAGAGYILAYAMFKPLLIIGAGVLLLRAGSTDLQTVRGRATLGGATALFALGALALAGLPPFSVWVIKDEILAAALAVSPLLYLAGLAGSVVTALYAGKMLLLVWRAPQQPQAATLDMRPAGAPSPRPMGWYVLAPMGFFAAAVILLAALGLPPVRAQWQLLLGQPATPPPAPWELLVSALLSLGGLLLAGRWWRAQRLQPWTPGWPGTRTVAMLARWLGLESAVLAVAHTTLRVGGFLARLEDRVVDAGVHRAAVVNTTLRSARGLARLDDRVVDAGVHRAATLGQQLATLSQRSDRDLVEAIVHAVTRRVANLGRQARRPQTGLLHQYYAQTASAVAALVLLLWLLG